MVVAPAFLMGFFFYPMALRNQPYIPLYIQDFLTDEKLMECSASATGVYIRIMCIMHKSEEYGKILLKQKDKQNPSMCLNFAYKLAKHLPYELGEVAKAIEELVENKVLYIDGDYLVQKRMVKDNIISEKRSSAGRLGVEAKKSFAEANGQANAKANAKAKVQANSEYEIENEIENENKKGGTGGNQEFTFWNNMPLPKDVGDLPELKIKSAIELVKITKGIDVTWEDVVRLWGVFKINNLTGKKYYASEVEVEKHFTNWIKNQKFENNGKSTKLASGKQAGAKVLLSETERNWKHLEDEKKGQNTALPSSFDPFFEDDEFGI